MQPYYVIDTSSLVALREWRPPKKYPGVWRQFDSVIHADRLMAPAEVYEEIRAGEDALRRWVGRRDRKRRLFRSTTNRQLGVVKEILRKFPDLVDYDRPAAQADPFIVAQAVCEPKGRFRFDPYFVFTEEKFTPHGRARIPHVCEEYRLQYLSIHQMFLRMRAEEDWEV